MASCVQFHLVCGSTGAGKSTYARRVASQIGGVRFSIDEWMTTLFWPDSPQPIEFGWAMERVNRCEAQIASTAAALVPVGIPAVLDLSFTTPTHRGKWATVADDAGAQARLHFLDVPADERWRRVHGRNQRKGDTFSLDVSRELFDFFDGIWEPPTTAELASLNGVHITDGGQPERTQALP